MSLTGSLCFQSPNPEGGMGSQKFKVKPNKTAGMNFVPPTAATTTTTTTTSYYYFRLPLSSLAAAQSSTINTVAKKG